MIISLCDLKDNYLNYKSLFFPKQDNFNHKYTIVPAPALPLKDRLGTGIPSFRFIGARTTVKDYAIIFIEKRHSIRAPC